MHKLGQHEDPVAVSVDSGLVRYCVVLAVTALLPAYPWSILETLQSHL